MFLKRIFIDATGIVTTPTGLGKYSYYLLKAMLSKKNFHFTVIHQADLPKSHRLFHLRNENVDFLPVQIPVIGPKREIGMFNLRKKIEQCDIYHCLSSYLPTFGINIPSVVTIHDLKYLLFPKFFDNRLKTLYYSRIIRRGVGKAKRVIAISRATKRDLIALGVPAKKITVIYESVTIPFKETNLDSNLPDQISGIPYLLFVGENRPHKNIDRIIEAHRRLIDKLGEKCPSFVFAGSNFESIYQKDAGKEKSKRLIFLGTASDEVLVNLYKQAIALVYPSLYEGFGVPILEAMALGTPVITSNCSSMPEVSGQAAILIEPHSVGQLVDAMMRMVQDKEKRERFRQLGLRRFREFSWEKTADMTIDLYKKVMLYE